MRLRARHIHLLEGLTDNIIGFAINVWLTIFIYNWWMGHDIDIVENIGYGCIVFFVSWARKYTVRRWFSNWINKIYEKRKQADAAEDSKLGAVQEQTGEG